MRAQARSRPAGRRRLASRATRQVWPAGLHLPHHRATTAHLCSAYPFQAARGLGGRGVYLGHDDLAGGGAFCYDPFELYTQRIIDSPNIFVAGMPRVGKSATWKAFLYRCVGALRSPGGMPRWCAIVDPKAEYAGLAEALGLDTVALYPGGTNRLNPLEPGPAAAWASPEELALRRSTMLAALLAGVLRRELTQIEDALLSWALEDLTLSARVGEPTLRDVAALLANPTAAMAARDALGRSTGELAQAGDHIMLALGRLLDRSLRGMFDGPSTVRSNFSGRGLVIDVSAVLHDPPVLTLVMIAVTSWLQAALAVPEGEATPRRMQVIDEAWALLGQERTAAYFQHCWKLCSLYGVANVAICHRISDLRSQSDDGTTTAKVALGLLADTDTRVLFRQASDQAAEATDLLQLTLAESQLVTKLAKGRALWKVGQHHTSVVQHVLAPGERAFTDTDARLTLS